MPKQLTDAEKAAKVASALDASIEAINAAVTSSGSGAGGPQQADRQLVAAFGAAKRNLDHLALQIKNGAVPAAKRADVDAAMATASSFVAANEAAAAAAKAALE